MIWVEFTAMTTGTPDWPVREKSLGEKRPV